jgi:predicted HTH domain antitoxin
MGKTITTRLPDEYVKGLKKIAEKEHLDTSAVMRKLLAGAIAEWKKNYAVEQYKKGEFSFGQLARFAEISVWDVPALLQEKKVLINYDMEEFESDLKTIKWEKKQ